MTDQNKELPIYRVKFTGNKQVRKWAVVRPDGTKCNNCDYESLWTAKVWLERYVALKYCREA